MSPVKCPHAVGTFMLNREGLHIFPCFCVLVVRLICRVSYKISLGSVGVTMLIALLECLVSKYGHLFFAFFRAIKAT
jgi:hypothetical protein